LRAQESIAPELPVDYDASTLGVLRGRLVRYIIRTPDVIVGRANKRCTVDIDLALEGPAWKVSRRQATIKCRAPGEFSINNDGRVTMFVDGQPLLTGQRTVLENNTVIEVSGRWRGRGPCCRSVTSASSSASTCKCRSRSASRPRDLSFRDRIFTTLSSQFVHQL